MARSSVWQPGPRPGWVRALNHSGRPGWVPLDPELLLEEAMARTGLSDFGGRAWREGFEIFLQALETEARLHLVGRVLARADVVGWLETRLRMTELARRHPEIPKVRIEAPLFITGLPRTGTSLLHELLARDPAARAPLAWEVRHPCTLGCSEAEVEARIRETEEAVRLWCEIVPEYDRMHELGARLPVECIQITAHEFRSDELSGRHGVPSYAAWLATADPAPAYRFHRRMLQLLQWQRAPVPGAAAPRWVLKAPSHLGRLEALLAVYPDARIVWTHRDPLSVIASVTSILFATAWVRSDEVDAEQVARWFTPETCAGLLDGASALRDAGTLDDARVCDVRYADLVAEPRATLERIYDHFGETLSPAAATAMQAWLEARPRDRHGAHRYEFASTGLDAERERRRFAVYQERYGVPSEVPDG